MGDEALEDHVEILGERRKRPRAGGIRRARLEDAREGAVERQGRSLEEVHLGRRHRVQTRAAHHLRKVAQHGEAHPGPVGAADQMQRRHAERGAEVREVARDVGARVRGEIHGHALEALATALDAFTFITAALGAHERRGRPANTPIVEHDQVTPGPHRRRQPIQVVQPIEAAVAWAAREEHRWARIRSRRAAAEDGHRDPHLVRHLRVTVLGHDERPALDLSALRDLGLTPAELEPRRAPTRQRRPVRAIAAPRPQREHEERHEQEDASDTHATECSSRERRHRLIGRWVLCGTTTCFARPVVWGRSPGARGETAPRSSHQRALPRRLRPRRSHRADGRREELLIPAPRP